MKTKTTTKTTKKTQSTFEENFIKDILISMSSPIAEFYSIIADAVPTGVMDGYQCIINSGHGQTMAKGIKTAINILLKTIPTTAINQCNNKSLDETYLQSDQLINIIFHNITGNFVRSSVITLKFTEPQLLIEISSMKYPNLIELRITRNLNGKIVQQNRIFNNHD